MAQKIGNPWAMEMEPKIEEIHQRSSCRINPKFVAKHEQLNSIEPHQRRLYMTPSDVTRCRMHRQSGLHGWMRQVFSYIPRRRERPLLVGLDRRHDAMIHIVDLHSCNVVKRIHLGHYFCWSLTNTLAGLICAVVSTPTRANDRRDHVLVINPTTGAVNDDDIVLPDDDMAVPASTAICVLRHVPVLGLVPSTGDYKVLRFSCYADQEQQRSRWCVKL